MEKFLITVLFWLGWMPLLWAQSQFGISLENPSYSTANDTFCLDLGLYFDTPGKLGTSNLIFSYDTTSLQDPFLVDQAGIDTTVFFPATLTDFDPGMSSLNLELRDLDSGLSVPAGATPYHLSAVCFSTVTSSGNHSVTWYVAQDAGTVMYLENESTQLAAGAIQNYSAPGAFPVEWLSFEAIQREGKVMLEWATAQEVNNAGFHVTRSLDGVAFETLDFVESQGNSSRVSRYAWQDQQLNGLASGQVLYYRLLQRDLDGSTEQSEVRSIRLDFQALEYLSVYPVPAQSGQRLNLSLISADLERVQLSLFNGLGASMLSQSFALQPGLENELSIDLPDLPAGTYYLRLSDQAEVYHFARLLIN
ncbi:MAG: T9SS type A sorting domain-containing protein [Bacteroidota bacterium]